MRRFDRAADTHPRPFDFAHALLRIVALAAVVAAALAAADARPGAFAVGVLRRDGVLLPFAFYDGRRWSTPWPTPAGDLTIPIDLRSVPKRWWGVDAPLDTWDARIGTAPRVLHVVQPDWVNVHCARYIGLRTDYQPPQPAPPRTAQPYPKDGVATSPPHAIDGLEHVALGAAELRALLPPLLKSFNDAEHQVEERYGHPIARRARDGVLPTPEAVYAYGDSARFYYVEATRPYRQIGNARCIAIASGSGWFVRDASGVRALTMVVDVLNCDREAGSYMLPLGVLRLADRLYWLAQFSGWDHERYVVLELKKKSVDVVVNRWGGAC